MADVAGIIFDKDGTLFDFSATWGAWCNAFIAAMTPDDPDLSARLATVLGYDRDQNNFHPDAIIIAQNNAEIAAQILPLFPQTDLPTVLARMDAQGEGLAQIAAAPLVPLLTGLRDRGIVLGIATNDSERSARAHVGSAGVSHLFDFIAGYDSGFGGKPAPGQLLGFTARYGLAPERCLMVGDSLHDMDAGRAAGMQTAAVLTGPALRATLAPHADVVLRSIADLPGWLDGH